MLIAKPRMSYSAHRSVIKHTAWFCMLIYIYIYMKTTSANHYGDVIMGPIASQITSPTIVYSTVYSDADQGIHQSSASLAFVRVIHRGPVNSPHKWPVTRKMFPFDDVIMLFLRFKCVLISKHPVWLTVMTILIRWKHIIWQIKLTV